MKIEKYDNKYIIYLNKDYKKINIKDKINIENDFRELFLNLRKNYNIKLVGYYNIYIYENKYYGLVIEIENEDLEYYDYFDDELDMKITILENQTFIYEILNDSKEILSKYNIIKNKDKLYVKLDNDISNIEMGILLENSKIIYKDAVDIIKGAKKIEIR